MAHIDCATVVRDLGPDVLSPTYVFRFASPAKTFLHERKWNEPRYQKKDDLNCICDDIDIVLRWEFFTEA
jgi:hypothetical protein